MSGFSEADWSTASLCDGWTNRDVAAHLTIATRASAAEVARLMVRARGGFDRAMDHGARQLRATPIDDILATLHAQADTVRPVPGIGLASPLADIAAHSLDVLIPLGRDLNYDAATFHTVLSAAAHPMLMRHFGFKVPKGVSFQVPEANWSLGPADGDELACSAKAMLAAITKRRVEIVDPDATELLAALR